MTNSLAHRDPATLVPANVNDRRRLAVAEVRMLLEDGVPMHPASFGQVILKHTLPLEGGDGELDDLDMIRLADKVDKVVFGAGR